MIAQGVPGIVFFYFTRMLEKRRIKYFLTFYMV
jgi:hypothetical protein